MLKDILILCVALKIIALSWLSLPPSNKATLSLDVPLVKVIYLLVVSFARLSISAYNTPSVEFINVLLPLPFSVSVALVTLLVEWTGMYDVGYSKFSTCAPQTKTLLFATPLVSPSLTETDPNTLVEDEVCVAVKVLLHLYHPLP